MFNNKVFVAVFCMALLFSTGPSLGQDVVSGVVGGLTGGNNGQGGLLSGVGGVLGGLTGGQGGQAGGLLGGVIPEGGLQGLLQQLLNQLGLGGQNGRCGLLAALLGGCPQGGTPCCQCCNQTATGVNSVCAVVGLLDFLVGTGACPTGSIVVCTAQACQVGQNCNAAQLGNLACVNVGKK